MIKGYIFDMDGTILDSLKAWYDIGNRYLASLNINGRYDLDDILKDMDLFDGASYLKNEFHIEKTEQEIIEDIKKIIHDQYQYEIPMKKGVKAFLKKCKEKGYQICLLTASDSHLAKLAFQRLDINQYFHHIYACHEMGINKQDPQSYLDIANDMQLQKEECIVVEDALYAIHSAKKAGFYTIAIYDEENKKDWKQIQEIANESYISFEDMEVKE